MADRPDALPIWADQDQTNPATGSNNVLRPPTNYEQYGWQPRDFPVRNWINWLGRYTYRWILWLDQQEQQSMVTNGNGIGLFTTDLALITLYAVDRVTPANYIAAVGYKAAGSAPVLNVTSSNVLTLSAGTISGNQPISGGSAANIIVYGQSKLTT